MINFEEPETLFYQSGGTLTQFSGYRIAHVTSELSVKDRWTEFDLFISEDDTWVLQGIGRSRVEGETDRYWAIVSKDAGEVLQGVLGNDVSRLAKKLISTALTNAIVEG